MDSINRTFDQLRTARVPVLLCAALILGACTNFDPSSLVGSKKAVKTVKATVTKSERTDASLVDTSKYLPTQRYDDNGVKTPYQSLPNPYLAMKGKIPQAEVNLYVAAISANRRGHYELARKKLEKLTEMSNSLSGPWVKLGQVAKLEGKAKEAEKYFRKAIQVNSKNVNAYIDLALILREQGLFKHAQNVYADALSLWADFPEAHLNLGVLYDLYLNKPENAQAHYEAYLFLTGYKNDAVKSWLSEVQNRTGIHESFIDTPPLPKVEELQSTLNNNTSIAKAQI